MSLGEGATRPVAPRSTIQNLGVDNTLFRAI
jgi:hypothetical protein